MPSRKITCVHCGKVKVIMVHKSGHINEKDLKAFEADKWRFHGGRNGSCDTCALPGLDFTCSTSMDLQGK